MKLTLTRQHDGNYTLTRYPPRIETVHGTGHCDVYLVPGEPIGIRHLCPGGVKAIFGLELRHLESVPVTVEGGLRDGIIDRPTA